MESKALFVSGRTSGRKEESSRRVEKLRDLEQELETRH